jgi:hypothetical protein
MGEISLVCDLQLLRQLSQVLLQLAGSKVSPKYCVKMNYKKDLFSSTIHFVFTKRDNLSKVVPLALFLIITAVTFVYQIVYGPFVLVTVE